MSWNPESNCPRSPRARGNHSPGHLPHAHLGGDARDDELLDAAVLENRVQVRGVECALAGLVDHRLGRQRAKLRDDVVPSLTADEDAAHRPGIPDRRLAASANLFRRRQIGEIRAMPLTRVDDLKPALAPRFEQPAVRLDGAAKLRDIVPEHLPEATRLQEVALHVDDHQSALRGFKGELVRLRGDANLRIHRGPI